MSIRRYLICLIAAALALTAGATTYYVDFDSGSDAANGTTTGTPWKHCKGDSNATGVAASTTLVADDVVSFKGGVHYRGQIRISSSGTSGHPITYKGDGWGTGKAIIDGSVLFTQTWTQCASSADCYGNTNYANIWYADLQFVGQTTLNTVIINDEFLAMAQDTPPSLPIYFDVWNSWRTTASSNMTSTTLIDTVYLTQATTDFWAGAYVAAHRGGNEVSVRLISAFDTATHKLTFDAFPDSVFYNPTPYSILGHPFNLTVGTYAVIGSRIWMWAPGSVDPNTLSIYVGKLATGIDVTDRDYVTFDGIKMVGYFGTSYLTGVAMYHVPGGATHHNGLVIQNCDFKNCRSMDQDGAIYFVKTDNLLVTGTTISQCLGSKGLHVSTSDNVTVSSSTFQYVSSTALYFQTVTNGVMTGNTVFGILGAHANGISVYSSSDTVLVEKNHVSQCGNPITYEYSSNVDFFNNFVDCSYGNVNEWGGMTGTVRWYNNTLVNSTSATESNPHHALNICSSANSAATYIVTNNIFDGLTWISPPYPSADAQITHTYNVWLGFHPGWSMPTLGTGEVYKPVLTQTFTNPSGGDYTLIANGWATGTGADLLSTVPTDIRGYTRTLPDDMGAYKYLGVSGVGLSGNVTLSGNASVK